jgi:hypothetical protein
MELPHPEQTLRHLNKLPVLLILLMSLGWQSCDRNKKVFKSDCDIDKSFKHIGFKQLIDSLADYDQKYVEVSGRYEEDKELSALINDSSGTRHSNRNALWVNFSQDCPLYLLGTRTGLFEYNDGQFTQINDKSVTIRGKIDLHNKGHLKQYRATIERVSLIKL